MDRQDLPPPTPEGDLIRLARLRAVPKIPRKAAAQRAHMSVENWGYIERGYRPAGGGKNVPVNTPPETIAHMAHVVGVTPDELVDVGREDAARVLRAILREAPTPAKPETPQPAPTAGTSSGSGPVRPGSLSVIVNHGEPDPSPEEILGRPLTQPEKIVWSLEDVPWPARIAAMQELSKGIAAALGADVQEEPADRPAQ